MTEKHLDREKLSVLKLSERKDRIFIERDHVAVTDRPSGLSVSGQHLLGKVAGKLKNARVNGSSSMIAFGAHTIKNGLGPVLISLMQRGWLTHLATNGAGIIHDWEFAFRGSSSEDVKENVSSGQFGIWEETGLYINLALIIGAWEGLGYGESVGKMISREGLQIPDPVLLYETATRVMQSDPDLSAAAVDLAGVIVRKGLKPGFIEIKHPYKKYSVQASAYELGIPFTGHPMIGHDIIYNHPVNHGAAIGRCALRDFLSFAASVTAIDHGVYISLGSAVMSPMIFEKALSMAQNISIQEGKHIDNHYMLVADIAESDWDWEKKGEPPVHNPAYYLRYCKTFSRMGGEMDYLRADNRDFLLALHHRLQ